MASSKVQHSELGEQIDFRWQLRQPHNPLQAQVSQLLHGQQLFEEIHGADYFDVFIGDLASTELQDGGLAQNGGDFLRILLLVKVELCSTCIETLDRSGIYSVGRRRRW